MVAEDETLEVASVGGRAPASVPYTDAPAKRGLFSRLRRTLSSAF